MHTEKTKADHGGILILNFADWDKNVVERVMDKSSLSLSV